jgi:predicted glycoside hydrolase/deacetylase ChbG (UPF0249 family)
MRHFDRPLSKRPLSNLRASLITRTQASLALTLAALAVAIGAPAVHAETWAEKLGYPAGKKILILHADDIGMCYEANQSAKDYLDKNEIQSAAMMVPCPWFNEFADWYKQHPDKCCGLHLTMNAEWTWYRWPPVAGADKVASLVDPDGYLWNDSPLTVFRGKGVDVETEIRAQVERALSRGIRPSHIDTHMGTLYGRPDFTAAYLKVAVEYRIPAMVIQMSPKVMEKFRKQGYPQSQTLQDILDAYPLPKLDDFNAVANGKTYEEKRDAFFKQIQDLDPGITEFIFHPSVDTEGLRHITGSWQQRVWEAAMFSDPKVKEFLAAEGIEFTNWREMMKRFDEKFPDRAPAAVAGLKTE